MRTISHEGAFRNVRDGLSAAIYEKRSNGWRKYSHGFGGTLECEDIDSDDVPSNVRAERKASGCASVYTNGFCDVRPISEDGVVIGRTVIIRDERSDVAAAGEFVAGLVKGFFR